MISDHTSKSIDIIRGLAALGVIWGHSIQGSHFPLKLNGAFWVWIFLGVSGYLVGKSFSRESYGLNFEGYLRFSWNRALRIVPLYEIAIGIGLLAEIIGNKRETTIESAFLQSVFANKLNDVSLAGPLWTVSAEMHFYAVSFLLACVVLRIRNKLLMASVFVSSVAVATGYIYLVGDVATQPRTFVGNLYFFVFGMALSTGMLDIPVRVSRFTKASVIGSLIMCAWFFNNFKTTFFFGLGARVAESLSQISMVPVGGAAICALLIVSVVLLAQVKSSKLDSISAVGFGVPVSFLAWCGFHTYGIYVWHSVLSKMDYVFFNIPPGPAHLLFLLLSLPLSYLSYRLIEAPVLKFKIASGRPALNKVS